MIAAGLVLKAGQIGQTGKLTLDGGERLRGFVPHVIHHKNYKYVICKTNSLIAEKSLISQTITVHIEKEVWHGEKTWFLGIDSSPHGPNLAAALGWTRTDADLPTRQSDGLRHWR